MPSPSPYVAVHNGPKVPITRHVLHISYRAQSPALHKVMQAGGHRARHCRVTLRNTVACVAVLGDKLSTCFHRGHSRGDKVAPLGWVAGDARRPSEGVLGGKNTHEVGEQTALTGITYA